MLGGVCGRRAGGRVGPPIAHCPGTGFGSAPLSACVQFVDQRGKALDAGDYALVGNG